MKANLKISWNHHFFTQIIIKHIKHRWQRKYFLKGKQVPYCKTQKNGSKIMTIDLYEVKATCDYMIVHQGMVIWGGVVNEHRIAPFGSLVGQMYLSDISQEWTKLIILSTAPGPGLIVTAKAHNCNSEIISKWTKGGEIGWLKRL